MFQEEFVVTNYDIIMKFINFICIRRIYHWIFLCT